MINKEQPKLIKGNFQQHKKRHCFVGGEFKEVYFFMIRPWLKYIDICWNNRLWWIWQDDKNVWKMDKSDTYKRV